jgi:hypothetical protein
MTPNSDGFSEMVQLPSRGDFSARLFRVKKRLTRDRTQPRTAPLMVPSPLLPALWFVDAFLLNFGGQYTELAASQNGGSRADFLKKENIALA